MAQNTACQCRISLDEIAETANVSRLAVVNHAARLGIATADDWAGRISVSTADASTLYAAVTGAQEANRQANQERMRAEREATRAREEGAQRVFQETYDRELHRGAAPAKATERATEARTAYLEGEHPGFLARMKQVVSR